MLLYNLWTEKELQSFLKKVSQTSLSVLWACAFYLVFLLPFTPLSGICEKQDWLKIAGFPAAREKKTQTKEFRRSVKESDVSARRHARNLLVAHTKWFFCCFVFRPRSKGCPNPPSSTTSPRRRTRRFRWWTEPAAASRRLGAEVAQVFIHILDVSKKKKNGCVR